MRVVPQQDGALLIEQPDEQTTYDTGNDYLFATFDGLGGGRQVLLVEGHYLGGWRLDLAVDRASLVFSQARAIGRLWELRGEGVDGVLHHRQLPRRHCSQRAVMAASDADGVLHLLPGQA